jgi:glycosyltransferase involved in cell wall biosynthesis
VPGDTIIFVTVNFPPHRAGGAERQALLQARELTARGWSVEVVCPRNRSEDPAPVVDGIPVSRLLTLRRPFERLSWCVRLTLFLVRRRARCRLIHVHVANVQADAGALAATVMRRPLYVKVASGGVSGEIAGRRRRRVGVGRWFGLRRATAVQALSPQIAAELREVGVAPGRIRVLPNGVDVDHFRPPTSNERDAARAELGVAPGELVVAFLGRFARYKGAETLLDAWDPAVHRGARLLLVGARLTEDPLGPIPDRPGLAALPWAADPRRIFHAADVFVHPALADGMPNSVLEAMACGVPVVAARTPAVLNVVGDADAVVLFEPANADALRRVLADLLDDADRRRALGEAGRQRALQFSHGTVVGLLERAYAVVGGPVRR